MRRLIWAVGGAVAVAVLLLTGILISIETGLAGHAEESEGQTTPMEFAGEAAGLKLMAVLSPAMPAVGETADLSAKLIDASGAPVRDVAYQVSAYHLEDEKDMVNIAFAAPDGTFTWTYQFFDGAAHELRILAAPQGDAARFAPVSAVAEVDVMGLDPPLPVKLKTTFLLLVVVLVGIIVGLAIRGGLRLRAASPPKRSEGEQTA